MAEAVVTFALQTLQNLLLQEAKFLSGLTSHVKGLEKQLKEMQCLLEDADRRRHESKTISNWIAEIRDLAYRSEDVIETYVIQVSSNKGCLRKLLRILLCNFKLRGIGSEITDIKLEIGRVYNSMHQLYGVGSIIQGERINSVADDENQRLKRQTYPFERDDCFVGMEDDLKRLVSLVLDKQYRVISIWGMGGIGKTMIARKIYNHDEIGSCFESFAWVCITQQCHIRSVMEEVLKQLLPHKREGIMNLSFTELVGQLCEVQRDKRCLVVLDDIWKVEHWDCLKDVFDGHVGLRSKVLLTTRKQSVADVGVSFKLRLLNVGDGWELLKRKAFPRNHVPG
ncbi:hypothetical protein CDL12_21819 [Handroanthus impetiginosus]|uniref:NB-ARC domain-containing protein n=1 Tax=Handroanthus impetiginosus TaxID=429701 RepID=A0A2G9GK17_9LAMI|nr:hypothetical protein CDL12_21819 [Handroanthus impetiginosus]